MSVARCSDGLVARGWSFLRKRDLDGRAPLGKREKKEGRGWKFHRDLLATGNRLGLVMTEALLMEREGGKKGRNWLPT